MTYSLVFLISLGVVVVVVVHGGGGGRGGGGRGGGRGDGGGRIGMGGGDVGGVSNPSKDAIKNGQTQALTLLLRAPANIEALMNAGNMPNYVVTNTKPLVDAFMSAIGKGHPCVNMLEKKVNLILKLPFK